jgi:hypothetical protein
LTIKYDESIRAISGLENKNSGLLSEIQRFKDLLDAKIQENDSLKLLLLEKEKNIENLNGQLVKLDKENKNTIFSLNKELYCRKYLNIQFF